MKNISNLLVLFVVLTSNIVFGQFSKKFILPDAKIKGSVICGGTCLPGSIGIVMPLYKKTFEPDINENSTEKLIAYSVLGRCYPESDKSGAKAWRCTESLTNPFSIDAITRLGSQEGTSFNYKRSEKLNMNVAASVETNLKELKKLNPGIAPATLTEFGARINAAYSKFAGKELTIVGKYSQWGINRDSIEALVKNVDYTECKKFLKDKDYRIILAIGMVYFDISYDENSLDKVAAELQADAISHGIKGNIAFSFKREVSKDLKKITKGYYQILVWRTAGILELEI